MGLVRANGNEELITPSVDMYESPGSFVVSVDMPGSWKDGIRITVESGILAVKGTIRSIHREQAESHEKHRVTLHYYRAFQLSDELDASRTEAEFSDGVLTLIIPKKETHVVREIQIQ